MNVQSLLGLAAAWVVVACELVSPGGGESKQSSTVPPPPVFTAPSAAATSPSAGSAQVAVAVTGGAASAASEAGSLTDYSQAEIGTLPENCVAPAVVLLAVPKNFYANDTFDWRHVRQVALANPDFRVVPSLTKASAPNDISFTENEHPPTAGVALVAHCVTSKSCLRFAAAYKAVVATAKPTVICGANPNIGKRIAGGKTVLPAGGGIQGVLPDKKDLQSQCIRLAACKAARDHQLPSDESQACMMKPGQFKTQCALKKSCAEVLACSGA